MKVIILNQIPSILTWHCWKTLWSFGNMAKQPQDERLIQIGERIRQLRKDAGYTSMDSFAHDHGFDPKQYWRLEAGKSFSMSTLLRILDIHKMTLSEFFMEMN